MMKKRILIIVYALLLCVTASFAWLSNIDSYRVKSLYAEFDNGSLTVLNFDFDAKLSVPTVDASGVESWVDVDPETDGAHIFDKTKMVPDSISPFKIRIANKAGEAIEARFSLALRIPKESVPLLDVIYIDSIAGDGFDKTTTYHKFIKLSEAELVLESEEYNEYVLRIYTYGDEILIPYKSGNFVTLDCSFYFDQNATAEYQTMTIDSIVFRLE